MDWIDDWLPEWQFDEVHHIRSHAAPGALLGTGSALAARRRFGLQDFVLLGRQGDQALAYGLAGRFWEPGYGLQPLADAAAFQAYAEPGAAKLVLAFEAHSEMGNNGKQTQLTTLTRVACGSDAARRRLAAYWLLIRPVSGLIRRRILADIRRVAEAVPGNAAD